MQVYFLSQGKLYVAQDGDARHLPSGAVENYRRNLREIQKRNEWKSTGTGAVFMGVSAPGRGEHEAVTCVEGFDLTGDKLIYAATLEQNCGLYVKDPQGSIEGEGFIVRQNDMRIYSIDCEKHGGRIIASVSDGAFERHLALYREDSTHVSLITEGQSADIMPSFSRCASGVVYYSSAGFYLDNQKRQVHYSSYGIYRLDMASGEITEVLSDESFDYIRPKQLADGTLYFIRRGRESEKGGGVKNAVLAPVKIGKALFGWLNFFTQRYAGESLSGKSGGTNPSKHSDKSDREVFIDGNLVNVDRALRENSMAGEKYPGIAPKSWELYRQDKDGKLTCVKKGVLDYEFDKDGGLVFSNGKYIVHEDLQGRQQVVCKADVAVNIRVI